MEFSDQANIYLKFRPQSPKNLIDFIVSNCPNQNLVWDCGTGNGQVASVLSSRFQNVLATDISEKQLENAIQKPNITYQLSSVEDVTLQPESLDLITVSQAFHWFDHSKFMALCSSYLVKNGVLAIWSYESISIDNPVIKSVREFDREVLSPYWNSKTKRLHVDPFDAFPGFKKINPEVFMIEKHFNADDLIGYISSWSATNKYVKQNKAEYDRFCQKIRLEMQDETVRCHWKVNIRIGAKV